MSIEAFKGMRSTYFVIITFCLCPSYLCGSFASGCEESPCDVGICSKVGCPPAEECISGHFEKLEGSCACCNVCVVYKDEKEVCGNTKTAIVKCKHGLSCQDGVCIIDDRSIPPSCLTIRKHRRTLLNYTENGFRPFSPDLWIPECDSRGFFQVKQCKKKKCFCLDENGSRLFGQQERYLSENMTCGCSLDMWLLQKDNPDSWMTKPQQHCLQEGNYDTLQCIGDICYCADTITGDVKGTVTKMTFMDILSCYDDDEHKKDYLSQCEKQLMPIRSLVYRFKRKGLRIVGLELVKCDIDGSFSPKQCETDKCFCTDRNGVSIKSYSTERKNTALERAMSCRCARDEHDREAFHARYSRMICDGGGNYEPHQCYDDGDCYCVDEDGDVIADDIPLEWKNSGKVSYYCWYRLQQVNNIFAKLVPPLFEITDDISTTTDDYDDYY